MQILKNIISKGKVSITSSFPLWPQIPEIPELIFTEKPNVNDRYLPTTNFEVRI